MGDSLTVIVVIILGAVLMFVFPMAAMSERNDDIAQLTVDTLITDFVNTARNTGKITAANYDKLLTDLQATGNTYDIPSKKKTSGLSVSQAEQKIGENIYYSIYTSQIMEEIDTKGVKYMKEGDFLKVTATNTNNTLSQMLKNFLYSITGNDTYSITGSHSGIVTVTGAGK